MCVMCTGVRCVCTRVVCLHMCGVWRQIWNFFLKGIVLERGEGGTLMNNTQHVQIVLHRIEALCTSVEAVMQATKSAKHKKSN